MLTPRIALSAFLILASAATAFAQPFRITVVDSQTHRGVPLVELRTTNEITCITDSAGVVAIDDPGLLGQRVYFFVASHGYAYPKDGFGFAGKALDVEPGGSATIEVERINIAERLYRITGEGIYADSVRLGDAPPIEQPVVNGLVTGQDTVQAIVYRGQMHWFWGDTGRLAYPLGNFATSGAVSDLPGKGGLDPSIGVNLRYFVDEDGFSRKMCPIEGPGPVWIDGLVTARDSTGRERLLCHYVRVKTLGELYEQGLAQYNDDKDRFEPVRQIPLDSPLHTRSHAFKHMDGGVEYYYFPAPYALLRCTADYDSLLDPGAYEAYTCLKEGTMYAKGESQLDRDASGRLVYGWKRNTGLVEANEQQELIAAGLLSEDEALIQTRDAETGAKVIGHSGSIAWNEYRQCYVMILQQVFGSSTLGEIWYLESPTIIGPWKEARKIITHDNYSLYNVMQHPEFDQQGGRLIYLEGTYTKMFTDNPNPTPRYEYNQIMYRLDLSDPRLHGGR